MPENLGLGVGIGSLDTAQHGVPVPHAPAIFMENGGWVDMENSGFILLE